MLSEATIKIHPLLSVHGTEFICIRPDLSKTLVHHWWILYVTLVLHTGVSVQKQVLITVPGDFHKLDFIHAMLVPTKLKSF